MGREDGTDTVGSVGASASSGSASSGMSDNFGMHDDSFGQQEYGGPNNLGGSSEDHVRASFNAVNQITEKNPYGNDGFFTRTLGIDPSKIDYSDLMDLNTRSSIANNQFSKFANPTNTPGQLGYNRQFDPAPMGQLRSGVQKANYQTAYGPVMEQARKQSTGEMLARGAFGGLLGGLPGLALGQIGTKEYGLPGVAGFERFDPNNPNPGGGMLGQFLGGVNPTQAKDALVGAFAPVVPAPKPTSIGTTTSALNAWSAGRDAAKKQAFDDALSSVMSQAQTSPSIANLSLEDKKIAINELAERNFQPYLDAMPDIGSTIVDGKNGFQTETLPDGSVRSVQTTGGMTKAEADEIKNNFENTKNLSAEEAAARAMERLENSSYNFFTDPQAGVTYPSAMAGEQLSGLFGEDPRTAGFRDLEGMIKSVVDGENLPDNQNMYGPGMPNQTPLTPDELNNLPEPYGMKLGRGPSSGGIMQLAV